MSQSRDCQAEEQAERITQVIQDANSIPIERGKPMPYIRGTLKTLFSRMGDGDSFVVPDSQSRLAAQMAGKRCGHKTVSEKIDGGGYRVWLVKKNARRVDTVVGIHKIDGCSKNSGSILGCNSRSPVSDGDGGCSPSVAKSRPTPKGR